MAKDNLVVDKLLKLKPTRAELCYPNLPTYEDAFEGETEEEKRQREQKMRKERWIGRTSANRSNIEGQW